MEIRYHNSAKETAAMGTDELRAAFLMQQVMVQDEIKLLYTHYDRVIIGGVVPVYKKITLPTQDALKADYFLQRRELGIINCFRPRRPPAHRPAARSERAGST